MRKKLLITIPLLLLTGIAGFYYWWIQPYSLPEVTPGITIEQYGLDFSEEQRAYPVMMSNQNAVTVESLKQALVDDPDNFAYSNKLRQIMAQSNETEAFISLADTLNVQAPRLKLQLALAYIDMLQNPDLGTASLGQISSRSISVLNEIIETNPYDWLAHYARGLNNLYWPSGLKRTDKAIQDLGYCLAVTKQLTKQMDSPLWPMVYTAYGDALVKAGRIDEGIEVWEDGAKRYPNDKQLTERNGLNSDEALNRVRETRGIDVFQRPDPAISDLSVLWITNGSAST